MVGCARSGMHGRGKSAQGRVGEARVGKGRVEKARVGGGRPGGWRLRMVCGAVVATTATGCASAPQVVPVPTFAPVAPTSTSAPPASETGTRLPADCALLLGQDELSALFGLPMDSVMIRMVQGTPSPSVGRLERITCTYTSVGPAAPPPQGVVLRMTVGAYRDTAAARAQHERNVADEQVGSSSSVDPALGTAAATLLHRDVENLLLTASDSVTLDLDLPPRPAPLPPSDLLLDLARRVLARLAPSGPDAGAPL